MKKSFLAEWNEAHLYSDRLTVYRSLNGSAYGPVLNLRGVPCRLSVRGRSGLSTAMRLDDPDDGCDDRNEIEVKRHLFCAPQHDLRAGDLLLVARGGRTETYLAGEPCRYPFFQQLLVYRRGEA